MSLLHKTRQQNKNNDPIIRLMAPMIAGILACIFCLVSMTWAWFTASVATPPQTIQSANRSTSVVVYEVSQGEGENRKATKKLIKPKTTEEISLAEDTQVAENEGTIIAGETTIWELLPEKTYEVVMTGSGTASTGYCEVELSHTASGSDTVETKLYKTSAFEKDDTVKFTYNTGGFSNPEGVTETEWKEYVEKSTPPTLAIASYWGKPAEEEEEQVSVMSLRDTSNEIMLLSDGDVLGLAPIPCPEAKAETEVELEGFEIQEDAEISAEEDYKVSLTLKEGYEMPSEVVVNIDGKDYVVSTQGSETSDDAPYYDAQTGVLTVPSALLSDGIKVSVKATATPIPEEEPVEEETEAETTEETTDENETEEDKTADTPSDNNVVADNPVKKEEDSEQGADEPAKTPAGDGGNDDDDDDKADKPSSGSSSTGNSSSTGKNEDKIEDEKADVKLKLSQLTINLEETQIPTNADLVLTLSAKEDMELPEQIVITLDKTIRDEDIDEEDIVEDKTEYVINTDGKDNPEGFEFDAETGELTISSELLEGVREITIADTQQSEDNEKATISFEVTNLTFDFTGDKVVTDEDIVITFTAGEGYELPETIVITIDGEEYVIYTSEEDIDKNPEGITFDAETGKLTISKGLLEDAETITITAEGIKKESESEESPEADGEDNPVDTDPNNKENGPEDDETKDKEDKGESENTNPDTESSTSTEPDKEDNADSEQGSDDESTQDGEESEEETIDPTPDTESGENSEIPTPTEPDDPSEPAVTPESPKTEESDTNEPVTGGTDSDVNDETTNTDNGSTENGSEEKDNSSESVTTSFPDAMPMAPTTSASSTSETSATSTDSNSDEEM